MLVVNYFHELLNTDKTQITGSMNIKVDGGCIIWQKFPKHFIKKELPASSPLVSEEIITFLFNLAYSASGNQGGQPGLNHTAKATYLITEPLAQAWSQRDEKLQPGNGFLLHNTGGSDGAEDSGKDLLC